MLLGRDVYGGNPGRPTPYLGENIDITDATAIFEKLAENKRGGWYYEMNGLFWQVLETLGFDVQLQLASVYEAQQQKW